MKTITRQELYAAARKRLPSGAEEDAAPMVEQVLGEISNAIVAGETVKITRFGNFIPVRRKPKPTARTTGPDGIKFGAPLPGGAPARNAIRYKPSIHLLADINRRPPRAR